MASPTPLEVNTLQVKFDELEKAEQLHQNSHPKIQKVAVSLRNRKIFDQYSYSPKFVSIGPIHHDNPNLKLGENYKLTWAVKYIQSTQHTRESLHQKIANNINELKGLYADDVLALANTAESLEGFRSLDEKLSWLLFVDGCSLLYILEKLRLSQPDEQKHGNTDHQPDEQKQGNTDHQPDEQKQGNTDHQLDKQTGGNTNGDQIDEREHRIKVDDEAERHLNIKVDQLVLVMMDVLLLENQLPYRVLNLLWKNDNENELIATMKKYLNNYHWATPEKKTWRFQDKLSAIVHNTKKEPAAENQDKLTNEAQPRPAHLLDLQRKMILKIEDKNEQPNKEKKQSGKGSEEKETEDKNANKKGKKKQSEKNSEEMRKYRNIQDLKTVGITLKSSKTRSPADVDFTESCFDAKLTLPEIVVDDTTEISFLNLIAYEMCPDFRNDYGICSYVVFMDSLIDHADDVKELRSKGILLNSLGSDEEVANLFNVISADLVLNPETYDEVKDKIHRHYKNRCNVWITQGYHTYFGNPWAIAGFLAALIALILTCVQTWFSIFPRGD